MEGAFTCSADSHQYEDHQGHEKHPILAHVRETSQPSQFAPPGPPTIVE